ncbi:uncharacterized protein LOC118433239 [Folsomia candida]|uniref:uncharacterized protein LOC118433239 n=1 Tax=Folsomia candida TaxID=158441 RepID=UPI001604CBBC|nr:uncharacterized protein LOC118433239 [Folsomia candida]
MAKRCPSAESGKTSPAQLPNPTTPPSVQDEIAQQSPLVSSPAQLPNPTTPPVQDEIVSTKRIGSALRKIKKTDRVSKRALFLTRKIGSYFQNLIPDSTLIKRWVGLGPLSYPC